MLRRIVLLGVGLGLAMASSATAALVLTFDDVAKYGYAYDVLPANYHGFAWDSFEYMWEDYYNGIYGNTVGFPSGSFAVYNGDGITTATIRSGTPFAFISADFAFWASGGARPPDGSGSVTVDGYLRDTPVGSATLSFGSNPYFRTLTANLPPVDRLVFRNDGVSRHYWLMDNFTYVVVPEPANVAFPFALGLLGFAARRQTRASREHRGPASA